MFVSKKNYEVLEKENADLKEHNEYLAKKNIILLESLSEAVHKINELIEQTEELKRSRDAVITHYKELEERCNEYNDAIDDYIGRLKVAEANEEEERILKEAYRDAFENAALNGGYDAEINNDD